MLLEITKEEKQQLMAFIEAAIKSSPSSLQAAVMLMPIAQKLSQLKEEAFTDS